MELKVQGTLKSKLETRQGTSRSTGNPWVIATYLLVTQERYEKNIVLEVSDGQSGRIARFDSLIGAVVEVSFEIDAHEYNGRWFNSIRAFGINSIGINSTVQAPSQDTHQDAGDDIF